ncbi:hypothetical protein GCM10023204_41500 [Actinomycetospora succinea]
MSAGQMHVRDQRTSLVAVQKRRPSPSWADQACGQTVHDGSVPCSVTLVASVELMVVLRRAVGWCESRGVDNTEQLARGGSCGADGAPVAAAT